MNNNKNIIPVILAGGSGTRLWPLSRKQFPKQFLSLDGNDDTLLQSTLKRIMPLIDKDLQPVLVCNEEHRFIVAEQIRKICNYNSKIILEPVGKNTAPAIALASLIIDKYNNQKDPIMLVLPADHIIKDNIAFYEAVKEALTLAESGKLVTFGIMPTKPETGYGYIEKGMQIDNGFEVSAFVEKPNLNTAQEYVNSGNYLWNSGMFMFKASSYRNALKKYALDIAQNINKIIENVEIDKDFIRVRKQDYEEIRSESIDYAVMEKADNVVVVELNADWSDIGSWDAVWENSAKDNNQNVLIGDVINIDSHNSYVFSDNRVVSIVGVKDLIVVDTKDAVLIVDRNQVQDVRKVVAQLQQQNRSVSHQHRKVYRPWGWYDSIDEAERFKVKRISVNPKAKLSLQKHHHRAEHWIVVKGTAEVTCGDKTMLLTENQSTYIPLGQIHRLKNPGNISLEIIEVQSGAYLEEDDIVRLEDIYGRG